MALVAVVSQLDLALRESAGPVHELGEAIARISEGLDSAGPGSALQPDVARCFESLQFYDRHTQHLSHLLDFLSGMTVVMDAALGGVDEAATWGRLRAQLRQRLISDEQRELLDFFIQPPAGSGPRRRPAPEPHANPGSIELF